jgi:hypothetical protein
VNAKVDKLGEMLMDKIKSMMEWQQREKIWDTETLPNRHGHLTCPEQEKNQNRLDTREGMQDCSQESKIQIAEWTEVVWQFHCLDDRNQFIDVRITSSNFLEYCM